MVDLLVHDEVILVGDDVALFGHPSLSLRLHLLSDGLGVGDHALA